jgi:peptide deformylase
VLRTPAEPVHDFDAELRRLVQDLTDTMMEAPGVGLAAPQIGVGLRVFTYYIDDELGFPGLAFPTQRSARVVASGFDMHGEPVALEGTAQMARCVQHETDHLDGVLFIDRLDPEQRKLAMKAIREAEWWSDSLQQVRVSPHTTGGRSF